MLAIVIVVAVVLAGLAAAVVLAYNGSKEEARRTQEQAEACDSATCHSTSMFVEVLPEWDVRLDDVGLTVAAALDGATCPDRLFIVVASPFDVDRTLLACETAAKSRTQPWGARRDRLRDLIRTRVQVLHLPGESYSACTAAYALESRMLQRQAFLVTLAAGVHVAQGWDSALLSALTASEKETERAAAVCWHVCSPHADPAFTALGSTSSGGLTVQTRALHGGGLAVGGVLTVPALTWTCRVSICRAARVADAPVPALALPAPLASAAEAAACRSLDILDGVLTAQLVATEAYALFHGTAQVLVPKACRFPGPSGMPWCLDLPTWEAVAEAASESSPAVASWMLDVRRWLAPRLQRAWTHLGIDIVDSGPAAPLQRRLSTRARLGLCRSTRTAGPSAYAGHSIREILAKFGTNAAYQSAVIQLQLGDPARL